MIAPGKLTGDQMQVAHDRAGFERKLAADHVNRPLQLRPLLRRNSSLGFELHQCGAESLRVRFCAPVWSG